MKQFLDLEGGTRNGHDNEGASCPTSHRVSRRARSPASPSRRNAPSKNLERPPRRTTGSGSSSGADLAPRVQRRCDDTAGGRPFRCRRRDLQHVHPPLEVARRHRHSVLYRDDERSTFSPMCLSVRQRPKRSAPTDAAMIRDGRVQVARSTRVREGETAHSGKALINAVTRSSAPAQAPTCDETCRDGCGSGSRRSSWPPRADGTLRAADRHLMGGRQGQSHRRPSSGPPSPSPEMVNLMSMTANVW